MRDDWLIGFRVLQGIGGAMTLALGAAFAGLQT